MSRLVSSTRSQSDKLSRPNPPSGDGPYDLNELSASALLQRQQRQEPSLYSRPPPSRPSSSSGSSRTLRRTPRFRSRRALRNRASPSSTPRPQSPPGQLAQAFADLTSLRTEEDEGSTTPRASRADSSSTPLWPVRSRNISRRTTSAILYALELALRGPRAFTSDLVEEQAQMSDLAGGSVFGNGRAQNGGSRAASGPQPVPQPVPPTGSQYRSTSGVRTPTDIMRQRRDREARRRAEAEKQQSEDEGRGPGQGESTIPTTRRVDAAGGERRRSRRSTGDPAVPVSSTERRSRNSGGELKPTSIINEPPVTEPRRERADRTIDSGAAQGSNSRPRSSTLQTGQAKPVQQQAPRSASANYPPQQTSQTRQVSNVAVNSQATSNAPLAASKPPSSSLKPPTANGTSNLRGNTSSFPHAFERWENLSSHWEGLTSYWIRRLEANSDESSREPLNQQMARQVTDLSAAGANLFHAVVELQRLRASSERKFQRWFFENRNEQERAREVQAGLEKQLQVERQARVDFETELNRLRSERENATQLSGTAEQLVKEKNRELQISKEEARRAWEELGRREQEERDRTASLRNGEPTLVGGVQVLPMPAAGGLGRDEGSNRPVTRDGPPPMAPIAPSSRSTDPGYTNYDPNRSETGTDPVSQNQSLQSRQAPSQPQQQTSNGSAAAMQASRAATQSSPASSMAPSAAATQAGTYLRYGPSGATAQQQPSSFYQHEGSSLLQGDARPRTAEADQHSYIQSNEDTFSDEDYELDANGQVRRDSQGNPLTFRSGLRSENSDEYDVQEELNRERMYGQQYGSSMSGVEYGSGPTGGPSPVTPTTQVDYSGRSYGPYPFEGVPRHHHPTRLSDVLEEDERSRTSPSRASERSRGIR